MPYEKEHSCRLVSPTTAKQRYSATSRASRRIKGKLVNMLFGRRKTDGKSELRSVRFPKDGWPAKDARAVCKEMKGTFEAAVAKAEHPLARFLRVLKAAVGTRPGTVSKSWAGMDDGQVREAITEALRGRAEFAREGDSDIGPWAQHLFEDHAIVRGTGGKLYRVDISELMGELVIGDPVEVREMFTIVKRDDEQHLVTGVVLQPDVSDAQDDVMTAAEIEKAAHAYMKEGAQARIQHGDGTTAGYADVVESWTARQDIKFGEQVVKAGAWLMTMHVPDDDVWAQVKAGDFTGFSPRGIGYREVAHG